MTDDRMKGTLIFGIILTAFGFAFIFSQALQVNLWGVLWPLIVIASGIAFFAAMIIGGKKLGILAIPGSIATTTGLILFFQNLLKTWSAWSYAWALIIVSVGLGLVIYGRVSDVEPARNSGWRVMRIGTILFLIFGTLFEFLNIVEHGLGSGLFPLILILAGIYKILKQTHLLKRLALPLPSHVLEPDDQHPQSLFLPILLTGLAVLWFLISFDQIPLQNLSVFIHIWPLLLVVIGLHIILKRHNPCSGLWLGLGFWVAIALFLGFGPAYNLGMDMSLKNSHFSEPLEQSKSIRLEVQLWEDSFVLGSLSDSTHLIDVDVTHRTPIRYSLSGKENKVLHIGHATIGSSLVSWINITDSQTWKVNLSPELPINLNISAGGGTTTLVLTDLKVNELRLSGGSGPTEIILPPTAAMRIYVLDSGEGNVYLPDGLLQMRLGEDGEGTWETKDFQSAPVSILISIDHIGDGDIYIKQ